MTGAKNGGGAGTMRMPAAERSALPDDEVLNQQRAAYYLGIGRATLGRLLKSGVIRRTRLSERVYHITVGNLREYERAATSGGEAPAKTKKGAK